MRIIAGKHKGRKLLECHKFKKLRPTTDRSKESLFNILSSARFLKEINFDLTKCDLLDVFSGSGGVSFEALSMGIKSSTMIENNMEHLDISKENAKILNEEKKCQFINFDLTKPLFKSNFQYNLIFIDPPYNKNLLEDSFLNLEKTNFIKNGALVIFEHSNYEKIDLSKLKHLRFLSERKYSKTIFSFFIFP